MATSIRSIVVRTRLFLGSAIVLTLLCSPAAAELRIFLVKGEIITKRLQTANDPPNVSVFAGEIGDEFYGTFTYDTDAVDEFPTSPPFGLYSLVDFSIDGTPLNVSTGAFPLQAGVLVLNGSFLDRLEIRGFHTPAIATEAEDGFNDAGVTSIGLDDFTGSVFHDDSLPDCIHLDAFDESRVKGPGFATSPIRVPRDEGVITEIISPPQCLFESLIADVEDKVDGDISRGLVAILEQALARLSDANQQNDIAACRLLVEAFINVVDAQAGKMIDVDDADDLIAQAIDIYSLLECL